MEQRNGSAPSRETVANVTESGRDVLLVGYGASGRRVTNALADAGVRFVVIEKDETLSARARADGHFVIEGDAADSVVLSQADVDRMDAIAITPTSPDEAVVRAIRRYRAEGVILTRLPQGFADSVAADATARLINRMTRILDYTSAANPFRGHTPIAQ